MHDLRLIKFIDQENEFTETEASPDVKIKVQKVNFFYYFKNTSLKL
jgi:hypothetical protein